MTHELGKLLVEIFAVLGVIGGGLALLHWLGGHRSEPVPVAAGVLAAFTVVFTLGNLESVRSAFSQAQRDSVGVRTGLEHCLRDSLIGEPGPNLPLRLPFVKWVKKRLPEHAVYWLVPSVGPPDAWCVALVLLPALPAGPGGQATWVITFGTVPPNVREWAVRHPRSVSLFAPGFELVRVSGR